jgi:hypothetical protein
MQQPPSQEYPQQQWQQPSQPLPPQQQWQPQTNYGQPQSHYPPPTPPQQQWNPQQPSFSPQQYPQQQWYQPYYTQPPTYYPTQQPPIQRPKRKRLVLWVSVSIIGAVLAILVVVSSVLIGYRFFTSTQYPTLHTEYNGTITNSIISASPIATVQMALIITSNDNQGHISGRMGILLAPKGGDPFIGTLGIDGTITFTATPFFLGVFTIFTGKVNSDSSISGTASNSTDPSETWKLFPVKGK